MTPERRQRRAKKKTVATPVSTKAHHCQLPATPYLRTCSVTQFGVSDENVVATIERPASHHGTERPEAKNSAVLPLERFARKSAGTKQIRIEAATMTQSIQVICMAGVRGCILLFPPALRGNRVPFVDMTSSEH